MVLFLLILVVGLAIVLAVASRTVTDIRTTTTSDESNRAYFAAEAGIEEALGQLNNNPALTGEIFQLDFAQSNSGATTEINTSSGGHIFVYPKNLSKDAVAQVNMLTDRGNSASGWVGLNPLTFYWGTDPAGPNGFDQAIEISIVSYTNSDQKYHITKIAFDPVVGRGNSFCKGNQASPYPTPLSDDVLGLTTSPSDNFYFEEEVNVSGGTLSATCVTGFGPAINGTPVLIRIRALYNTDPFPVAVVSAASDPLPGQGSVIDSTGKTPSGVTRKLQVVKLFSAVPSIFDYVLFSGSTTNPLQK